jgi:dTDP-4-dehydrorhamnose reductase
MRALIFGETGQLARALQGVEWPGRWTVRHLGRADCNLAQPGAVAAAINANAPDIVINAAAYTDVDRAESERSLAFAVNGAAVAEMARASAARGVPLVHISTDYVFDGTAPRPYRETDFCAPLSVYGASKLAGEVAIRDILPDHVILRTSWVFAPHGRNFVRTMLRLGAERDEVAIVDDQFGRPTAAGDLAAAIRAIAVGIAEGSRSFGTFHFAGAPETTWHGFGCAVFDRAVARGLPVPRRIRKTTSTAYNAAAMRPANSVLDCSLIAQRWGIPMPQWGTALDRCIEAWGTEHGVGR